MNGVAQALGARAARALSMPTPEPAWQPLRYFNVYRVLLAGLFTVLVVWGDAPQPLGEYDQDLFQDTVLAYFAFSLLGAAASRVQWPPYDAQVIVQVFVDIFATALFMHASGGVNSGFGMLLVVAVAGGSILARGGIALLFAVAAALAVLVQQYFGWSRGMFAAASYTHVGMLAAAFLATAYITHASARRIRASEALAARREVDLANLAQLNEHIIRRMQAGILAIDAEGHIRLMNRSAQRLLGVSQGASGEQLAGVLRGLAAPMQAWRHDMSSTSHLFQPEGTQLSVMASFAAIGDQANDGVLVFLEDASAISQRAQHLKLAGLGRLAASIAHEIRNPLGAVSHASQLLGESANLDKADRRLLQMVKDNTQRMNAIIENVLQLSRGRPAEPESLALGDWLHGFAGEFAAGNAIGGDVLSITVEPPDLRVRFDPSQLRQVIWNLCENGVRHSNGAPSLELRAGISRETRRPYLEVNDDGEGIKVGDE
ncbi:MAG: histidine kinase dimerization/phospho-acceptor domain-containing protein, partial [Gammaproteobacteria bacterium]|nr:histidine kinase dimerization/phospho-acceptor domain-containing protein [Gammaproteobacteria bacterium]